MDSSLSCGFALQIMNYRINKNKKEGTRVELMEVIKGRRSIRKYRPDPVPDEVLQKVFEGVRWAPSWANTQCWEVIVVKDAKVKSELATTLNKMNPALSSMTGAPVVLALCGKKGVSGLHKSRTFTVEGDWLLFDTGIAIQNLCLTAYSLGLGTVIIGSFDHKKAQEILGVPQNVEVVAMTPLGYPAAEGMTPKRKEISEFVFQEKYRG
jgi:nitroreductase